MLYPHLKKEAHLLPNLFSIMRNRRHANEGTFLQGGFYHEPNRRRKYAVNDVLSHYRLILQGV
jgi:hypothetical protein